MDSHAYPSIIKYMEKVKITIIGAGIIGLSIAYELSKNEDDIIVLEKNETFGQETSSRNSEVMHAGLYYKLNSLKAKTCVEGNRLLYELCQKHNIAHKKLGKIVLASDDAEITRIHKIYDNGKRSQAPQLEFLSLDQIKALEPDVAAKGAFISKSSGIIDSHGLMDFLYKASKEQGTIFSYKTEVMAIEKKTNAYFIRAREPDGDTFSFESDIVINAAGLYSDKVASMVGIDIEKCGYEINYCRGQYFRIRNPKKFNINHLIYPLGTDISLGIHITPDLAGGLRLGPDAKFISQILYNFDESELKNFYVSVKQFLPGLLAEDLIPDTLGIRPKLQKPYETFRDFVIKDETEQNFPGFVNCIGIESPGLTSCLSIAKNVKNMIKAY